jgi:signal transduction histidine kinase
MAEQIHRETHLCSLTDRGNLISLLPPHRRKEVLSFFNRVRKGERLNYQVQYGKKWIEITLVPIPGKESYCQQICACLKDISYLKSAEQKRISLKQKHHNDLTNAFIEGQENERKQIGRELHDNINQVLAATKLNISLALANPGFCQRGLELSHSNIIHAIDEIRKLSHQLLPPDFSNGSFIDSIEYLVQSFSPSFQVCLDVARFSSRGCSDTIKLNLFRILQEQLNNIYKYAAAENVSIKLSSLNNKIMLVVKDDGAGTDMKKESKGVGLTNICNRVSSLNGQCTIWSKPNQGFRLSIQIPTRKQQVKRKRTPVLVNA